MIFELKCIKLLCCFVGAEQVLESHPVTLNIVIEWNIYTHCSNIAAKKYKFLNERELWVIEIIFIWVYKGFWKINGIVWCYIFVFMWNNW